MRKLVGVVTLCTVVVIGCNNKSEELEKQISQLHSEASSLQQSIAERDKYFEEVVQAVNDVYKDLEQTRAQEAEVVERTGGIEGPAQMASANTKQRLINNISAINSTLIENRKRIAQLQSKVKSFGAEFASLNKLVESLKQTLQERERSIAALEARIQGLESTVAEKTQVIQAKEELISEQQKMMNTAYYVVGTKDELKQKGIIRDEGGFLWGLLGSTTVMASDFDESLFTPIDKTKDETIHVGGTIREILPRRKPESYATAQPDKSTSDLTIGSPQKFWQDRYLVIVLD